MKRTSDPIRLVVVSLAIVAIGLVGGLIYLASVDRSSDLTVALVGLAGTAIGNLGSMLSRTSGSQPTEVVAPAGVPLAVEEVAP